MHLRRVTMLLGRACSDVHARRLLLAALDLRWAGLPAARPLGFALSKSDLTTVMPHAAPQGVSLCRVAQTASSGCAWGTSDQLCGHPAQGCSS